MQNYILDYEAIRIDDMMNRLSVPNSPAGSHYMVKFSDAIKTGSSYDLDYLCNALSSKTITMSGLKDRKGLYALDINKISLPCYKLNANESTMYYILRKDSGYALISRITQKPSLDPTPYIVANKILVSDNTISWDFGSYHSKLSAACSDYFKKINYIQRDTLNDRISTEDRIMIRDGNPNLLDIISTEDINSECLGFIENEVTNMLYSSDIKINHVNNVVTEKFGYERCLYVLAQTVNDRSDDGRITPSVRAHAAKYKFEESNDLVSDDIQSIVLSRLYVSFMKTELQMAESLSIGKCISR